MNSSDSDDLAEEFLTDDTQNFLNQGHDAQDGVEMVTLDNTDDSSNQGEVYELKFGKPLREQDRFLPIANIAKIMKKSIPDGGKIAKDARECVQECVSEFISFITSEASDRCFQEKRKTINGEDILYAMSNLGFDNYVEPLKLYLQKYREATKGDKSIGIEELSDDVFSNDTNYTKIFGQNSQSDSVIYFQDPGQQFHIV